MSGCSRHGLLFIFFKLIYFVKQVFITYIINSRHFSPGEKYRNQCLAFYKIRNKSYHLNIKHQAREQLVPFHSCMVWRGHAWVKRTVCKPSYQSLWLDVTFKQALYADYLSNRNTVCFLIVLQCNRLLILFQLTHVFPLVWLHIVQEIEITCQQDSALKGISANALQVLSMSLIQRYYKEMLLKSHFVKEEKGTC